jgi:hypothetical protein
LKLEENCLDTCRMRLYIGFVGFQPLDPFCTIWFPFSPPLE